MTPEQLNHFQNNFREKHDPFVSGIKYLAEAISSRQLWTHDVPEPMVPTARQRKKDIERSKAYQSGREMGISFNFGNVLDPKEHELVKLDNAIHLLDRLGKLDDDTAMGRMIESIRSNIPSLNQDPNHIPRSFNRTPTENFIYLLNANKGSMGKFLQSYANEMFNGIHTASLTLISRYNLPEISKRYLELALTINYESPTKNQLIGINNLLDKHNKHSSFKIAESVKYLELYFHKDYLEHVKGFNLGTFILGIVDSWKPQDLNNEFQGMMKSIPRNLDQSASMKFLDRINGGVTEPSFWLLDTADFLILVRDIYLEFVNDKEKPTNNDYMNIIKVSILNLCYSCIEPKNRKFIKKAVAPTLLQKALSKPTELKGINYFRDRLLQSGLFPKVGTTITLSNYGKGHIYAVNEVSGDVTVEFMDNENEPYFEQFSFAELTKLKTNG